MAEWTGVERAFVGAAYALTWAVLVGYAFYLRRRLRRAREAWHAPAPEAHDAAAEVGP